MSNSADQGLEVESPAPISHWPCRTKRMPCCGHAAVKSCCAASVYNKNNKKKKKNRNKNKNKKQKNMQVPFKLLTRAELLGLACSADYSRRTAGACHRPSAKHSKAMVGLKPAPTLTATHMPSLHHGCEQTIKIFFKKWQTKYFQASQQVTNK